MKPWLISFMAPAIGNTLYVSGLVTLSNPSSSLVLLAIGTYFLLCIWQARKKQAQEAAVLVSAAVAGIFFGLAQDGWFVFGGVAAIALTFFGLVHIWMNTGASHHFFAWFVATAFTFHICFTAMHFYAPTVAIVGGLAFLLAFIILWLVEIKRYERQKEEAKKPKWRKESRRQF